MDSLEHQETTVVSVTGQAAVLDLSRPQLQIVFKAEFISYRSEGQMFCSTSLCCPGDWVALLIKRECDHRMGHTHQVYYLWNTLCTNGGVWSLIHTSFPPANRAILVELEWRQIWCSPGVWEVKVNRPSEPYWRDKMIWPRQKTQIFSFHSTQQEASTHQVKPLCLDLWSQRASRDLEWKAGRKPSACPTAESCTFLSETSVGVLS